MNRPPKNVIIILVDALRNDCLGCSEDKRFLKKYQLAELVETPTIDRFAREGVRFTQAVTTAPETPPAHASLFTGTYPPRHGIRSFFGGTLSPSLKTIWEVMRANGYRTVCFNGHRLFEAYDLTRGCDEVLIDRAEGDLFQLLGNSRKERLFLFAHFCDCHYPYTLRETCRRDEVEESWAGARRLAEELGLPIPHGSGSQPSYEEVCMLWQQLQRNYLNRGLGSPPERLIPLYAKAITRFDRGRLNDFFNSMSRLGILGDSLVIITADHGEAVQPSFKTQLGGNLFGHSRLLVEGLIRIPLIFWAPGRLPANKRIDEQASQVDIMPTILDLIGIDGNEATCSGRSLVPNMRGRDSTESVGYCEAGVYMLGCDLDEYVNRCKQAGTILQVENYVSRRCIRTPEYKYEELGEELSEEDLGADNETFVKQLFRKVLAQRGSPEAFKRLAGQLDAGEIERGKLLAHFRVRAGLSGRESLYCLRDDPDEEVNLLALDRARYEPLAGVLKDRMEDIAARTPPGEVIKREDGYTEEEVGTIFNRLEQLGYL